MLYIYNINKLTLNFTIFTQNFLQDECKKQ